MESKNKQEINEPQEEIAESMETQNRSEPLKYIDKKPQKYLGPSQFATVLGMSQFKNKEQLKEHMENGYRQAVYSEMAFGNKYEATALYCYRKNSGETVVKAKWLEMKQNRRIGGVADGLLVVRGEETAQKEGGSPWEVVGGVEIKCHPNRLTAHREVPDYYLVQIAGYMTIYQVKFWDFMSCCLSPEGDIRDFCIKRVFWDDVKDLWENEWYPKLEEFINQVEWQK
jgi:hypothetical protein